MGFPSGSAVKTLPGMQEPQETWVQFLGQEDPCSALIISFNPLQGFPQWLRHKESVCSAGDASSVPGSGRFPWRRSWQPTPVFLPGEFRRQRKLAGYSPGGHKESDISEHEHMHKPLQQFGKISKVIAFL